MDKEIFKNYFLGKLTSKEQKEVEIILKSKADNFLKGLWYESDNRVSEAISRQLQIRIDNFKKTIANNKGIRRYSTLKIAAAFAMLIGIGGLLLFVMNRSTGERPFTITKTLFVK